MFEQDEKKHKMTDPKTTFLDIKRSGFKIKTNSKVTAKNYVKTF